MGSFLRTEISLHTRKKYSVFGLDKPALHLHNREGWEPILPASQLRLFSCFMSSNCTHNPKFILYPMTIARTTPAYLAESLYFRVSSTFIHWSISISIFLHSLRIDIVLLRLAISSHSLWEAPSPSLVWSLQNISRQRPSPFLKIKSAEQGTSIRSGAVRLLRISSSSLWIEFCSVAKLLITSVCSVDIFSHLLLLLSNAMRAPVVRREPPIAEIRIICSIVIFSPAEYGVHLA